MLEIGISIVRCNKISISNRCYNTFNAFRQSIDFQIAGDQIGRIRLGIFRINLCKFFSRYL